MPMQRIRGGGSDRRNSKNTTLKMSLEFEKKGRLPAGVSELHVVIYSAILEATGLYNSCR